MTPAAETLDSARHGVAMTMSWFGMYYPHVRFRDEHWLKLIALYWDRVYRLRDADEIYDSWPNVSYTEQVLTGHGFVKSTHPSSELLLQTARQFSQVVGIVPAAYRISETDNSGVLYPVGDVTIYPPILPEYVADWKIALEAQNELRYAGLAIHRDSRLWMHPAVADAYLLLLGSQVADQFGASLVGDDIWAHAHAGQTARQLLATALRHLDASQPTQPDEIEGLLINVAVTTVLPRNFDEVPATKIVEFRQRYEGERARFRDTVHELLREATELENVRDRDVLEQHLRVRYETRLAPALKDLDRALRGQRIETVLSATSVQVAAPAAITTGLAALAVHASGPAAAIGAAAGLALGVTRTVIQQRRDHAAAVANSPVAYLHLLQRDLAPATLIRQIRATIKD